MSIKVKCENCGAVCGVRQPMTFRLMRGAKVDIIAGCRTCNESQTQESRIEIKCQYCGISCGSVPIIIPPMLNGTTVDVMVTCRTCNEPKEYKPDPNFDFNDLLKTFGMK